MNTYIYNLKKFGQKLQYLDECQPLYRGILHETLFDKQKNRLNLEEYKLNRFHCWPGFTSSTKDKTVAVERSRDTD